MNSFTYVLAAANYRRQCPQDRSKVFGVELVKADRASSLYWLGYRLDDRGMMVRFPGEERNVFFSEVFRSTLEPTNRPLQLEPEYRWPEVKRSRCETDYAHPLSAKFKNDWSCFSSLPHVFTCLQFFLCVYCRYVYGLPRTQIRRQREKQQTNFAPPSSYFLYYT
jgi:hypothetical protein